MNQIKFYRFLVILNGFVPLLMLGWDAFHGQLGANAVNNALHVTGLVSLVFLFLSLVISPLKWLTGWGGWIGFRRTLGLYGFFYALVHLAIYMALDRAMNLSSTLHEIWMRRFLQIGAAGILLMVPLAVTSTNSMVRRLGAKRWKLLHRTAYLVAAFGVLHYFLLVKSDVRQPLAFAAVLFVLLSARIVKRFLESAQNAPTARNAHGELTGTMITSVAAEPAFPPEQPKAGRPWKGELRIAAIFQETPDVRTLRLAPTDGSAFPFAYLPGQFLNLQLTIDGKRVNRCYTIASAPTRQGTCELSIRRQPQGLASRFIHDHLAVGDILTVSGPAGNFTFTGAEVSDVLLIAGGVGITPLMSMVRYLTDCAWPGNIYFLIIEKTESDLIFRDEIEWLARRFPRLKVCTTLTRCEPERLWGGERGRPTESLIKQFVPELTQVPVYLCGPNAMMDEMKAVLERLGVPGSRIRTEAFSFQAAEQRLRPAISEGLSKARKPEAGFLLPQADISPDTAFSLNFVRSMIQTNDDGAGTILEIAETHLIVLPNECRAGICGQCKTRLIEGTVVMDSEDALSPSEKACGFILACQARATSNLIVDA